MQSYTWFYSLAQNLDAAQEAALKADFDQFLAQWNSHGTPVDGLVQLRYGRFVVIQSNPSEARPSGCSIDSLKRSIGQILQKHGLEVLDSSHVFYRSGTDIHAAHFKSLSALVKDGSLTSDSIVFDHSLAQSDDLSLWELPLKQTWMKRYLPTVRQ